MKIFVTGVSGTGKTSIARALIAEKIAAVDIDDISHWENKITREDVGWEPGANDEWYNAHDWLCDIDKLKEVLASGKNAAAIGHSSNLKDYIGLFDKVFVLTCSPETLIKRIEQRTDNDFGKHPADRERILNWQKTFDDYMVGLGATRLDAEKPLDQVVAQIRSHFD